MNLLLACDTNTLFLTMFCKAMLSWNPPKAERGNPLSRLFLKLLHEFHPSISYVLDVLHPRCPNTSDDNQGVKQHSSYLEWLVQHSSSPVQLVNSAEESLPYKRGASTHRIICSPPLSVCAFLWALLPKRSLRVEGFLGSSLRTTQDLNFHLTLKKRYPLEIKLPQQH